MAEWIRVAEVARVGIEFVHHARKAASGEDPDEVVDSARGASARFVADLIVPQWLWNTAVTPCRR